MNALKELVLEGNEIKGDCQKDCVFNRKLGCSFIREFECEFKHVESVFTVEELLELNEGWGGKAIVRSLTEPALRYTLSAISNENAEEIKAGISHDYLQAAYALHRMISENLIVAGELRIASEKNTKLPGLCCGIFQDPHDAKDEGRLFFLATREFNENRKLWHRYMKMRARLFLAILLRRRRLVRAIIDARFPKTIRWLESLGFAEVKGSNVTVAEYAIVKEFLI